MFQRNITQKLLEAFSDTPVVLLHGARQTGKSTLVRQLIQKEYPAQYLTLDDLGVLSAAREDPAGFLAGLSGPIILDEVQRAPALMLAIKAEVDRKRQPGRFLLTGSAQVLSLPQVSETLAGRVEILPLYPLSQGEIEGVKEGFIDALFAEAVPALRLKSGGKQGDDKDDVMNRALAGGYPEALARPKFERRRAWHESYISTILQRDVRELCHIERLTEMPWLLNVLANRAGGLINYASLARDAGLNQVTLRRYFSLLHAIFLVHTVPPWFTNRLKRLMKSEKLYLYDTGLLAQLIDLTPERLRQDPTSGGALIENFVAAELVKQRTWCRTHVNIFHLRDYAGTEVDFILEGHGGRRIVGIEVKASATVGAGDFRGLKKLAEALGSRFHRGVVLYRGAQVVSFGANLHAIPLNALWRLGATEQ